MEETRLIKSGRTGIAIAFSLVICGFVRPALADGHHHVGGGGGHHGEGHGHGRHAGGYNYVPQPNYYYAPEPDRYYYTAQPQYYAPAPSQGINLFFGLR